MKLSEAIRLGAMVHPQSLTRIGERNASGDICATCALGAANVALGFQDFEWLRQLNATYPHLLHKTQCPVCHELAALLDVINLHIGCTTHRWTREQIAAWVATIEPQEETSCPTVSDKTSAAASSR